MPDLPAYVFGFPLSFSLSAAICFADLREAAYIGFKGRRSRYPVNRSLSCWALAITVGLFGCAVYLAVIAYPELVAGTPVAELETSGWLLASIASGLGSVALIRSKLVPIGDKQVGLDPIYEMAKESAIDNLVQCTARAKQRIVDEYAGQFSGKQMFASDLKDYVLNLLAPRSKEDIREYENQRIENEKLLAPVPDESNTVPDVSDAVWQAYHHQCIKLAADFLGPSATRKWLKARAKTKP